MGKNSSWKPYNGKQSQSRRPNNQGGKGGKWDQKRSDGGGQRFGIDLSKAERSSGSVDLAELQASEAWGNRAEYSCPKRKYAVSFGYLGSAYSGLQANPGCVTVEQQLERALFLAGGIQESNFGILQKLQWSRAARTDKGVHANVQCCAMKLAVPISGQELITQYVQGEAQEPVAAALAPRPELPVAYADLDAEAAETARHRLAFIARVNSHLPEDIRLHTLTKVTKNFNAKSMCERRRYHYLLPTYLTQSREGLQMLLQRLYDEQGPLENAARDGGWALNGQTSYLGRPFLEKAHAGESVSGYRIDHEQLEKLRNTCKLFQGTHKFHNYTTGKTPTDASSTRYIVSFSAGEPYVSPGGVEWVLLTIVGQSFLLNQIRKMVGMVCEVTSGATGPDTLARTLSNSKVECPMMPGLGLYLDELFFDGYNNKMRLENKQKAKIAQNQEKKKQEKLAATPAAAAAAAATATAAAATATAAAAAVVLDAAAASADAFSADAFSADACGADAAAAAAEAVRTAIAAAAAARTVIAATTATIAAATAAATTITTITTTTQPAVDAAEGDEQPAKKQRTDPSEGAAVAPSGTNAGAGAENGGGGGVGEDQDFVHEFLEWGKDVHVQAQWQSFRTSRVWPHIHAEELSSLAFLYYLDALRVHPRKYVSYDFTSRMPNDGSGAAAEGPAGPQEEEQGGADGGGAESE